MHKIDSIIEILRKARVGQCDCFACYALRANIARKIYEAHVKPLEEALAKAEAERNAAYREQAAELVHYKRALEWLRERELLVDGFAAPCQCEERHFENDKKGSICSFGEDSTQCCPKFNFRGTGGCWVDEALEATKEQA